MSVSTNPLKAMTRAAGDADPTQDRPEPSFATEVLPGFKKALTTRRAIRAFDGQPMPEEVVLDCLRDAILAPSASNLQTYEIYWIRDAAKKARMPALCLDQPAVETAGELFVVVARADLWRTHLKKLVSIMTQDGTKPLDGPVGDYYQKIVPLVNRTDRFGLFNLLRRVVFIFKRFRGPFVNEPVRRADHRVSGQVQASLAAQTLMLSIAAHGYESCPLSGVDKPAIARLLDLPSSAEIAMVVAAGRGLPEGLMGPRVRLPFDDLVKEV